MPSNTSFLTCGGNQHHSLGLMPTGFFPRTRDKYLSRQTSSWEAKTTLDCRPCPAHTSKRDPLGASRPTTEQHRPRAGREPGDSGGTWDEGDRVWRVRNSGKGLALLPVCCHPALDCREFRLEHVWDRPAEQGRGWAPASPHSQLLLLLSYPALLKPLDLSSEPGLEPSFGDCWPGCSGLGRCQGPAWQCPAQLIPWERRDPGSAARELLTELLLVCPLSPCARAGRGWAMPIPLDAEKALSIPSDTENPAGMALSALPCVPLPSNICWEYTALYACSCQQCIENKYKIKSK